MCVTVLVCVRLCVCYCVHVSAGRPASVGGLEPKCEKLRGRSILLVVTHFVTSCASVLCVCTILQDGLQAWVGWQQMQLADREVINFHVSL